MTKRQHAVNKRTAAGDALSGLVFRVLRLSGLLGEAGDALAKPAGQSSARWQVLAAVENDAGTVAAIARALGLTRQSVQRVADVLADEKLVAYVDNPEHQRAKLLSLTPTGRAVLSRIQAAQRAWADALGADFRPSELEAASAVLDRLLTRLS